jgi:2-oxoglutarate dehydrogenase E2 component (dihydrolipoamide succinyltransferase)
VSRKTPVGRVSPVVARISAEHSVDLTQVAGTGRNGRITKHDVLAYVEQRETAAPVVTTPTVAVAPPPVAAPTQPLSESESLLPHTTMRRAIAKHMVESKHTSPHVTTVFEFDFSAVWAHRKAHKDQFARDGARLTFTPYLVMATAEALKAHPQVNSSWRDDGLVLKRHINIGMATAIDDGLIVPVIRGADGLNLLGLARVVADLAERARTKRLKPDEVQGGTFSITNHGVSGSLFASPIINQPQCGILGVGKIEKRVCVIDDMIAIRPKAYVSFTFDHRILDGASADNFVSTLQTIIETWS